MDVSEIKMERFLFLAQYDWIHNFQVTHVYKDEILKAMPAEWASHLQLLSTDEMNNLPFVGSSSQENYPAWPPSLHEFLSKAATLSVERAQVSNIAPAVVDVSMARGMNPKKLHEVSWMAAHVNQIIRESKCDLVIDIGSGLGYLDHVLHQVYGHRVVGLEISDNHTSAAEQRAVKQGLTCNGIKSVKFDIKSNAECYKDFENLILDLSKTCTCGHSTKAKSTRSTDTSQNSHPRVCLIGLHCCGDLSTSALAMFHSVPSVQAICCVCCCYHKMAYSDGSFPNFPLSYSGQQQYEEVQNLYPTWSLSPFTFRLGAQETRCRWKTQSSNDHAVHIQHVAYRGLLEMTEYGDPNELRQRVRKCDFSSIDAFLDSYISSCDFSEEEKMLETQKLRELYEQHKNEFHLIEILTCLQVIVQPVIETLVYQDRLQWLQEQGHTDVKIIPIFDEIISPRNLAIVTVKTC